MGPRLVGLAAVFYGALLLAAATLGMLWDRNVFALGGSVPFGLFVGLVAACGTVTISVLAYRFVKTVRKLSDEIAHRFVDGVKRRELALLALFSGVGEETFFRGALQPELGIVFASLLFGALHVGPDRRYLVWTVWALGAGFLFGFLYEWTAGLLAPMTAHVLHNAATLLFWKRSRPVRGRSSGEARGMDTTVRG